MILSDTACEALAQKQLFCELQIPSSLKPVTVLSDSQSAIDVRYRAIPHYIHDYKININYIPTQPQPANLFTKALGSTKHQWFCQLIGPHNGYKI